jgi:hypothetical protein
VKKSDAMRVESISAGAGKGGSLGWRDASRRIQRIAHERMSRGGEMDADLMRAPGLDRDLDQRRSTAMLEEASPAPGPLPRRAHGVNRPEERVGNEADRMIENRLALGKAARHDAAIAPFDLGLPGAGQRPPCLRSEREENDPRCSPTETMERRSGRIPPSHPREKRVLEEASPGKRREPRRLGHSENLLVLVEDREARGSFRLPPGWTVPFQRFPPGELAIGASRSSIDQDQTRLDPPLPFEGRRVPVPIRQVCEERSARDGFRKTLAIGEASIEDHGFRPTT